MEEGSPEDRLLKELPDPISFPAANEGVPTTFVDKLEAESDDRTTNDPEKASVIVEAPDLGVGGTIVPAELPEETERAFDSTPEVVG